MRVSLRGTECTGAAPEKLLSLERIQYWVSDPGSVRIEACERQVPQRFPKLPKKFRKTGNRKWSAVVKSDSRAVNHSLRLICRVSFRAKPVMDHLPTIKGSGNKRHQMNDLNRGVTTHCHELAKRLERGFCIGRARQDQGPEP